MVQEVSRVRLQISLHQSWDITLGEDFVAEDVVIGIVVVVEVVSWMTETPIDDEAGLGNRFATGIEIAISGTDVI